MKRLAAICLCLLAACSSEPPVQRHAFFALGTLVEISLHAPPPGTDEALREVEQAMLAAERRWRAWGEGDLAEVNRRLAQGEAVTLDAAMSDSIARARALAEASGGRFNPAVGRQVEAWGFHEEQRPAAPPPADGVLAALLPPPALAALKQDDDGRWRSGDARLWIDMGAFAKGLAVDIAIEVLRARGIENAIVNAGGDLKVIGRAGQRAWRIGIRDPHGGGVIAAIDASGAESVFTSGDYERFFEWDGVRHHHIIDPRSARPARGVISVTVVHDDAAVADAAATALFVAGEADWPAVARAMGISAAMLVLDDGRIQLTPSMRDRLRFEQTDPVLEVFEP